jgi:hypothetical protein
MDVSSPKKDLDSIFQYDIQRPDSQVLGADGVQMIYRADEEFRIVEERRQAAEEAKKQSEYLLCYH